MLAGWWILKQVALWPLYQKVKKYEKITCREETTTFSIISVHVPALSIFLKFRVISLRKKSIFQVERSKPLKRWGTTGSHSSNNREQRHPMSCTAKCFLLIAPLNGERSFFVPFLAELVDRILRRRQETSAGFEGGGGVLRILVASDFVEHVSTDLKLLGHTFTLCTPLFWGVSVPIQQPIQQGMLDISECVTGSIMSTPD